MEGPAPELDSPGKEAQCVASSPPPRRCKELQVEGEQEAHASRAPRRQPAAPSPLEFGRGAAFAPMAHLQPIPR
eukprot:15470198-Alexandrium_andersonii.AAC.1